jgi:ADP-ribose pyrophosphatase YjhB (NUDIX family)
MSERERSEPRFSMVVPEGDDRERRVCDHCGFIDYENPRVVVGAVPIWEGKVLLCRRGIEPRHGYWTIPAGFLEKNETAAEGAAREALEEARVELEIGDLLAFYQIPHIAQLYLIYRARLVRPEFAPGTESLEVRLFAWDEIPWDDLAFPTVRWSLRHYLEAQGLSNFPPFTNPH